MQSWPVRAFVYPPVFGTLWVSGEAESEVVAALNSLMPSLEKALAFLALSQGGGEISLQTAARGTLLFLQRSTFGGIICEGNGEHS